MAPLPVFLLTFVQAVLIFGLHSVKADFSDSCVNVNSTNSTSCIHTYEQLYNSLTKSENSFNIESALYPAKRPSSVRVFVNVCGPNKTKNSEPVAKYTWSISCLYVALPPLVLEILSLGSILVDPRTQDLNIQIPYFCCNVSDDDDERRTRIQAMIEGVLAALQDLAVSPGLRDPTLNTAECVIEGHETDIDATGRSPYIRLILWSSFSFVLVSCNLLSSFLEEYRKLAWPKKKPNGNANGTNQAEGTALVQGNEHSQENTEKKKKTKKNKINTAKAICFLCVVLAIIGGGVLLTAFAFSIYLCRKGNSPPDIVIIVSLFIVLDFVVSCARKILFADVECSSAILTICATVTSYISCWLLIGIMINPAWGLTVTLLVGFWGASIAYARYEYLSATDHKRQVGLSCVCGVFAVIFLGIVAVMAGQSYNGRETADETVKTALLSVIGLLVSWVSWKRHSSDKQTSNGTSATSEGQTPNEQTSPPVTNGDNMEMDTVNSAQ